MLRCETDKLVKNVLTILILIVASGQQRTNVSLRCIFAPSVMNCCVIVS